jgi:hypothetical protein
MKLRKCSQLRNSARPAAQNLTHPDRRTASITFQIQTQSGATVASRAALFPSPDG